MQAFKAAEAAQCAHDQGKFWEYHDVLFANQRALSVDDLQQYASQIGLDDATFASCLEGGEMQAVVQADLDEGASYGVNATPAFFINGRPLSGALPFEEFKKVIDDELARLGLDAP